MVLAASRSRTNSGRGGTSHVPWCTRGPVVGYDSSRAGGLSTPRQRQTSPTDSTIYGHATEVERGSEPHRYSRSSGDIVPALLRVDVRGFPGVSGYRSSRRRWLGGRVSGASFKAPPAGIGGISCRV